jgi:UDP:flavonoid glycosyltransferase YjiC (YdhE family)
VKVLAYTSPARGHLYPIVPIVAALAERGHHTAIHTLPDELEQLARIGIECSAIDPAVERIALEDWRERSRYRAGISVLRTFLERAGTEAADLARAIDKRDPDVLLLDINCWGAATVAEACGRPWAVYSPYLLPLQSPQAPPVGPGLAPMRGPLGAVRDAIVRRIVSGALDRTVMPTLNALRARHGLTALDRFSDLLARPRLLLALTAEGFEYRRGDWPANVRFVGPMDWAPSHPAPLHPEPSHPPPPREQAASGETSARLSEMPPWLSEMRDPLVLVTCSTERQADERLIAVALQALPAAGMSVIATTAAHDPGAFDAPSGSRVVRFVPHEAILRRAACVVCHGGMGITQKALAAEVPVVVVPFGRDQLETARRVEVAKAGVRLSPRRLTPERLADAVRTAVGRRAGAQRVSRAYAAAGGRAAAADAIEALGQGQGPAAR